MSVCVAAIVENSVGFTVTVGVERASPHRLQTLPLVKPHDAALGKRYHAIDELLL